MNECESKVSNDGNMESIDSFPQMNITIKREPDWDEYYENTEIEQELEFEIACKNVKLEDEVYNTIKVENDCNKCDDKIYENSALSNRIDNSINCFNSSELGQSSSHPQYPDFVPSLFKHTQDCNTNTVQKVKKFNRLQNRNEHKLLVTPGTSNAKKRKTDADISLVELPEVEVRQTDDSSWESLTDVPTNNENNKEDKEVQVNCDIALVNKELQIQIKDMKKKIKQLEKSIEMSNARKFGYGIIENDDKLTTVYTGLPSASAFIFILDLIKSFLPNCTLTSEDMLLMTLMKLKLAVPFQDLSVRFGISLSLVSHVFNEVLDILEKEISFLIVWPSRRTVKKNLPAIFKNQDGLVRSIIDCTEWFIERPSNLKARSQTYSTYKHRNTVKFLVSVTPNGAISFVSECWGGRVSDKILTQECGFLNKLKEGDVVMADRDFLIEDDLRAKGAKLLVPVFTKDKSQLSQKDVETSRKLSRAQIHVKRTIECIKRFKILQTKLPLSMMHKSSKIVKVVCALTNLLPPLVPPDEKFPST